MGGFGAPVVFFQGSKKVSYKTKSENHQTKRKKGGENPA
jgi:hypothetical protein